MLQNGNVNTLRKIMSKPIIPYEKFDELTDLDVAMAEFENYLSDARVKSYEKHHSDLRKLKRSCRSLLLMKILS